MLLSQLHASWKFGCDSQKWPVCVCVVLLEENFLLGPWSKSFGTGQALKVMCVMLSPELAVAHRESSLLSNNSWAVYTTVSFLHEP